jgi:hypothetical protein
MPFRCSDTSAMIGLPTITVAVRSGRRITLALIPPRRPSLPRAASLLLAAALLGPAAAQGSDGAIVHGDDRSVAALRGGGAQQGCGQEEARGAREAGAAGRCLIR